MNKYYPNIFKPIKINGVVFKNRIWTAPAAMPLLYDKTPNPTDHLIEFYAEKAEGGSACVTVSAANMDMFRPYDVFHSHENFLDIESHRFWAQLTDAIHFYGAKASLELLAFNYHSPDQENQITYSVNGGNDTVRLTRNIMEQIAELYAIVAENALRCGFDMILIHGGHGVPLSEILSPIFNRRDDEFGGSLENRAKFPIMILDAIREKVGDKLLIEYRISGDEFAGEEGFQIDDCIEFLKIIQDKIDIAHISAGGFHTGTDDLMAPSNFEDVGRNTYLAEIVKKDKDIHIPVLTLGGYQNPDKIEEVLKEGKSDIVAMARGTIADPHMVNKAKYGKTEDIIPCIKCFNCLDYSRETQLQCSVNPTVGRELRLKWRIKEPNDKKNIIIIGGGPAGMQSAIVSSERGHNVTLFESSSKLGGKLSLLDDISFKKDLCNFRDYLINKINNSNIDVRLNTKVTPNQVKDLNPDCVIAAIGSVHKIPDIKGINNNKVITASDVFNENTELNGENYVIIGGGKLGCETALYLCDIGKKVTIIHHHNNLAKNSKPIAGSALLKRVQSKCNLSLNTKCIEITDNEIICEKHGSSNQILQCR